MDKNYNVIEIKAKRIVAGPGMCAYVAEAEVLDFASGESRYVTYQEYEGKEFTVSKESVYAFLAENREDPASEFLEEYESARAAGASGYAGVFEMLKKVVAQLG